MVLSFHSDNCHFLVNTVFKLNKQTENVFLLTFISVMMCSIIYLLVFNGQLCQRTIFLCFNARFSKL
jgi:hypothetical protein